MNRVPKLDDKTRDRLVSAALTAQKNAYMPYSQYPVGAALLATDGQIYTGCNVENASYGATICAERTAIVKAVSEGARTFQAIAVTTNNGAFPCGVCRQVLNEFAQENEMLVITADSEGRVVREISLSVLLPGSFGPDELSDGLEAGKHGTT